MKLKELMTKRNVAQNEMAQSKTAKDLLPSMVRNAPLLKKAIFQTEKM